MGIKDVLYKIRWFFVPYLLVLMACVLIKFNYSRADIYFAVNSHNFSLGDTVAPYLTDLGNFWSVVVISVGLSLFNYSRAFLMLLVNAITALFAQVIKHIFDAPRPTLYFQNQLGRIHLIKGVDMLKLHSFPSGHTVSAFTTGLLITYWCRNKGWGLPLLFLAMAVGYSRMYLSEHFFEDVMAGSTIGVVLTVVLITWLGEKKFLKSAGWNKGLLNIIKQKNNT